MGQLTQIENPLTPQIVPTRSIVINLRNHELGSIRLTHPLFRVSAQTE